MIATISITLIVSMIMAHIISTKSTLNRIAKASMAMTLVFSVVLLAEITGYLMVHETVRLMIVALSVFSLTFVGTMLNTSQVGFLKLMKNLCWASASVLVFYTLVRQGMISIT
jgi:hypothetical protein